MGGHHSKILHGITSIGKGILHTASGVVHGASLGAEAGPWGALAGGIGSGLVSGLSQIDPIISSFKGSNGSTPVKVDDIGSLVNQASDVFSRAGSLVKNNPQMLSALSDATRGKISSKLLQMGQYSDAAAKGLSSVLYKGGLNPVDVEKMASPVMNLAQTQLSRKDKRVLESGRNNAMLLSTLAPDPSQNIIPS